MQFYRCKCGEASSHGSMPPPPCRGCKKCGTTLATHPENHSKPEPHQFQAKMVDTDEGPKPLTRCEWCLVREANG